MSRRAALAAAPSSAISSPPPAPPPPPPPFPFSETRDDEAARDAPVLCALSIHAIGAREAAPRRSTLASIDCSDEGIWFPLCALLARDDAGNRAAATLLSARKKVSAACVGDFARGSFIGLDFGRLGEGYRLRGAALSLSLPYVRSTTLDCATRAAWACRHGAQPLPDASLRAFGARGGHDLVRADADAAMRDRAAAVLLAARDKTMRVFAGSARGAPLGAVPRAPAPVAFPLLFKRTGKAAWQIPADRGLVLGIGGAPCRTGNASAFSPRTMVSAAARPYSTWGAPRRATAASYPCVPGGAVRVARPSSRGLSSYAIPDGLAASLGRGGARRAWGPYSGSAVVFSVGSFAGSMVLLGLGYYLRQLFRKENKINKENRELRSAIEEREKHIDELKARWTRTKFAPGEAP